METLMLQIISIIIVIILFSLNIFSKRLHYIVSGLLLISIGVIDILFNQHYIDLDIHDYPIVAFALYFILFFAGKDLLVEAFKEENKTLKYTTLILSILIIVITTIPTLNSKGVIDFNLPIYPRIIDQIIYIISGIFLLIGTFVLLKDD
jgi:NhaP-type Na+/H+ or K+/H+ antiporter